MTAQTRTGIDFSTFPDSDGEPMAETLANRIQMIDLIWALGLLLARQGRTRAIVSGNQFIYYNPANGRDHVSPDVYVVLDRDPPAPPKWQTWVEGKFPEIVFEISSESTMREDVGPRERDKPALYARLGAREYYIYDPQGDLQPAFQGYHRQGEGWVPAPVLPSGGLWSPLLGAALRPLPLGEIGQRPAGTWLRVIDSQTGEPIPVAEEQVLREEQARLAAEALAQAAEERVQAEGRARLAAEALAQAAEEHAQAEEQARLSAEERAQAAEAALRALLAERRGPSGPPAAPTEE
jgi:Uma2 family endonuclease